MGRREHAPWPDAASPWPEPPQASVAPQFSWHTDAVEIYVIAVWL